MSVRPLPAGLPFASAYRRRISFFSRSERTLFLALDEALSGDHIVLAKVRLLDLCEGLDDERSFEALNRVYAKHVDFLVLDRAKMQPWRAIELDDRSHRRPDRMMRDLIVDAFFRKIGVPLVRLHPQPKYDAVGLRYVLERAVPKQQELFAPDSSLPPSPSR